MQLVAFVFPVVAVPALLVELERVGQEQQELELCEMEVGEGLELDLELEVEVAVELVQLEQVEVVWACHQYLAVVFVLVEEAWLAVFLQFLAVVVVRRTWWWAENIGFEL